MDKRLLLCQVGFIKLNGHKHCKKKEYLHENTLTWTQTYSSNQVAISAILVAAM